MVCLPAPHEAAGGRRGMGRRDRELKSLIEAKAAPEPPPPPPPPPGKPPIKARRSPRPASRMTKSLKGGRENGLGGKWTVEEAYANHPRVQAWFVADGRYYIKNVPLEATELRPDAHFQEVRRPELHRQASF